MTRNQAEAIKYAINRVVDNLYLTDATIRFTKKEIEKCRNVIETSLNRKDASRLLDNFTSINTWRTSSGACNQFIERAKKIIATIYE